MAKSIRSKWKRKCRAVKRERYGKKELDRLKKTLGIDEAQNGSSSNSDITMNELSEIVTVTTVEEFNEKRKQKTDDVMGSMEDEEIKKFNPKTLRNENGAYPIWLHPRKIKKTSKKTKKRTNPREKLVRETNNIMETN
ncbi:hypothetical protein NQ314_010578 [Rhamnusium bicolor]|uniref:Protein LLP homolog n=1 Tax=Rhamnusium bicolor TaxID=1586634 RepID=A0AAV8XQB8_9CUCU|nr:hypothetical protein NQ314_010578 [Rhamnusium bicolor]